MEKSESIKMLSMAMVLFQKKKIVIKKDSVNPFFKMKYASLSCILDAIQIPLSECGLLITHVITKEFCLETYLIHSESEQFICCPIQMNADSNPQKQGSAITYARRYAIGALLSLNIEDDDDGNVAAGNDNKLKDLKKESNPTPQPTIDNHVHAVNSIKKCTTMAELVASWKRTTLETQSHPAVEDELNAKIKEIFEASTTEKELADSFKAGKDGGLYSKTSKNIAFLSGIKDEVKLKLTPKA